MIKESKMDHISTPWVTVCLVQLLSRHIITGETKEEGAEGTDASEEKEVDTVVEMTGSIHVCPFQTEILEGKIPRAPTRDTHVMVAPIGHSEAKQGRVHASYPLGYRCCMHIPHSQLAVSKYL